MRGAPRAPTRALAIDIHAGRFAPPSRTVTPHSTARSLHCM